MVGQVECGYVYVDGSSVGEITDADLKDRRILGEEGFISVITWSTGSTGQIVSGPDIHARGFAEDDAVFDDIKPKIAAALEEAVAQQHGPHHAPAAAGGPPRRSAPGSTAATGAGPMIVPVVLEA